jgi:hypothetical protein
MASPNRRKDSGELDRELEAYRDAAVAALDQLEWCISYLHGLRKANLARALQRNRDQIVELARIGR